MLRTYLKNLAEVSSMLAVILISVAVGLAADSILAAIVTLGVLLPALPIVLDKIEEIF